MSIKHALKMSALRFGLEINRYNPVESAQARLVKVLDTQRIDTVIDVGANDGGYGRLLREGGFEGTIVSFEPLEQEHARLSEAARADERWTVAPRMALGDTNGEVEIHVAGNSASSSILPMKDLHERAAPESRYVGTQRVALRRLDEVQHPAIQTSQRLMLKIDTQGYEMAVLRGAEKMLPRLAGVQLELSLAPLYEGQTLYLELIDWLRARGFDLWSVIPGFVDPSSGRMLQFDGVFFRAQP
ncbi:MAG TPA: FkbM family methyltransferase [Burkholderiaceae bacterium]|jgi:FkbM family methyltransferase|nr:FkbM family methyltransferase [Burkholderiaceae bacterium]